MLAVVETGVEPDEFTQVIEYVVAVVGDTAIPVVLLRVDDVAGQGDNPPVREQDVALVDVHLRFDTFPVTVPTIVGVAVRVITGFVTAPTVVVFVVDPAAFVQVIEYVVSVVSGPVVNPELFDAVLESPPPVTVQLIALEFPLLSEELQERVADPPIATVDGDAAIVTTGGVNEALLTWQVRLLTALNH